MADGSVHWRVWAPAARTVDLVLWKGSRRTAIAMSGRGGFFEHSAADVADGQLYAYCLDGGPQRPDPCSLWQPQGVHGPSAVVRTGHFHWTDSAWLGLPRQDLVFYELHAGTFTPEGTFEAIVPRLAALRELGVTALELMPVGQFPGTRNWGYDGVSPYAVQDSYGGPHGLQQLVDACHAAGLALFLDVVYNHFGPEGNYLSEFGPYFTDQYKTPWGSAVNYDGRDSDPVRDFVLDNARMWLAEYHLDGLRVDAVHAIYDLGARHVLAAIQEVADDVARQTGRRLHVIAESDLNDPRVLRAPERGGYGLDAQWADDFHHAVHAYLTGERQGYYQDYGQAGQIARALESAYLYAGDYSPSRGRKHGAPPEGLTGDRFVVCLQNHDQVGNRATGERLTTLLDSPAKQRLAASLLLLAPYLPLLFMGEEYGEDHPFPFFCSFGDPDLVQAVRAGRRREFASFAWQGEVPDPQAEATFARAKLTWSWPEGSPRAGLRKLYQDLLEARRLWPALRDFVQRSARLVPEPDTGPVLELVRGQEEGGGVLLAYFNLGNRAQPWPAGIGRRRLLFRSESPRYGAGPRPTDADGLAPCECAVFGPAGWHGWAG